MVHGQKQQLTTLEFSLAIVDCALAGVLVARLIHLLI